jgi:hypothetical protein
VNRLRLLSAGGILGIAGLMALPASTAHAATVAPATGTADSSALTVTLNPEAVFNMTPATAQLYQTLKPLTDALSGGKGLGTLSLSLDRSRVLGSLSNDLTDLVKGHSDSAALAIDFHGLDGVLGQIDAALKSLTTVTGTLSGVLQTAGLAGQLSAVTSALSSNDPLTSLINTLGVSLNASTSANYNNPPAANTAHSAIGLVDLAKVQAVPQALQLQLAPFEANAVPLAQAAGLNLSGAEVEAHNTTTSLALVPKLAALGGLDIASLLKAVTSLNLSAIITQALGAASQGPAAVQGVLNTNPALAGLGASLGTVTQTVNGTAQQVVDTAPLKALQAQLDALAANLSLLKGLTDALPNLNSIIKTDGVTSTAKLVPLTGNTVQAIASTKLVDLHVLPIANLPGLGNASLLDVVGVSSSADTSLTTLANQPAWHDATSSLSEIDVLGKQIVGPHGLITNDQLLQGLQKPIDINVPGVGGLEIVITRGAPTKLDTAAERKATISALEIKISAINGPNLLLPLTSGLGGGAAAASQNGLLADVQVGAVATDVQLQGAAVIPTAAEPQNPSTGMFGPLAVVGGAGLAAVALLMQLIPRVAVRRRRDG